MSNRLDARIVDPGRCWLRHVRRTAAGEVAVATIGAASFTPQPLEALGGAQGWQRADVEAELAGDGTTTVRFPNAAGEDGVLHRRRFAVFVDDNYRPGEEWLELYRDTADVPVAVVTPLSGTKSRQEVSLKCIDVATHLNGYRGSELDVWDGHAPRDVFEHYTRLPALVVGSDFAAFAAAGGAWNGWAVPGTVTAGPSGRPRIANAGAVWSGLTAPTAGAQADNWTSEARFRLQAANGAAVGYVGLRVQLADGSAEVAYLQIATDGTVSAGVPGLTAIAYTVASFAIPAAVSLRIIARNERLFYLVNGELVAELRRPAPFTAPGRILAGAWNATADVDAAHLEHLLPYALRGAAKGDRRLPGLPPPVGLRARYYNAAGVYANNAAQADRHARLFALADEPITERLDATIDVAAGAASFPPGLPGAWAARWVGAIYLDLAAGDRRVRLTPGQGNARLYVGRTMRDDPAASSWAGAGATILTTPALRAHLGTSESGWYPLVIEAAFATAGLTGQALKLEDGPADGSAYATVPSSRLSPVGVLEDQLHNESSRTVLDNIATTFGVQWRTDPRSLESGEFPGQIIPLVRVGRDTELVIDDLDGTDVQAEVDAADAIDSLVADAAGIADPKGSGQLSAQVIDYDAAAGHVGMAVAYESLSEVTELSMLETRLGNLLALRSSPAESVGVRPRGQQDLADTFPLTGQLALMRWRPGDGVRLELDDVDVIDRTPRQMTSVARTYVPAGVTAPTVAFRQRPRSSKSVLKRTLRAVYALGRNYQGTLTLLTGGYVGANLVAGGAGGYSLLPLPQNLNDLSAVFVDVGALNTGSVVLEVNGVAGPTVNAVGRYDVTRLVKAASAVDRRAYARATAASAVLTVEYWLVAVIRI